MLADEVLPRYDVAGCRQITVRAPVPRVYDAILAADLNASPLVRVLLPPAGWSGRWRTEVAPDRLPLRLTELQRLAVTTLAECPPRGIVLGAIGRFWSVRPRLQRVPADFFEAYRRPGFVKVVVVFEVIQGEAGTTRLWCEARFLALDQGSRRRFRAGWVVGKVLVWLFQREALRVIRNDAERRPTPPHIG